MVVGAAPTLAEITQSDFTAVTVAFRDALAGAAAAEGASLAVDARWDLPISLSGFGGAGGANICGEDAAWTICVAGGVARRAEIDADALALILCHELGHYVRAQLATFATIEEESDYYATAECFRVVAREPVLTMRSPQHLDLPQGVVDSCRGDGVCERGMAASLRLARYSESIWEGLLGGVDVRSASFERSAAPANDPAQCRLDIYRAGLLGGARPGCDWS